MHSSSFAAVLCCLIAALSVAAAALGNSDVLPSSKFAGVWHGYPSYAVIGPYMNSSNGFTFVIHATGNTTWLMEDQLVDDQIRYSAQQFWVTFDAKNASRGTNIYCGHLVNFLASANAGGLVMLEMKVKSLSASQIVWQGLFMPGLPVEWKLTLSPDGNSLRSYVTMPSPDVVHLDVTFKRNTTATLDALSAEGREIAVNGMPPPCNTLTTVPHAAMPDAASVGCPHMGRTRTAALAKHVAAAASAPKSESAMTTMKLQTAIATTTTTKAPAKYQTCVRVNVAHDFKIRYNWNVATQSVDVHMSARPLHQAASQSWIAIGILPEWPLMRGMDIALAHLAPQNGTGCVRSMYAKYSVGTPVENPSQVLKRGSVWTEDNDREIHATFSRPWKTGHFDLTTGPVYPSNSSCCAHNYPVLSFALGRAPSSCSQPPHYHFGARGTHGWLWPWPEQAFTKYVMC